MLCRKLGAAEGAALGVTWTGQGEGRSSMRIAVISPPKTGNRWLKCLLGSIYELRPLEDRDLPGPTPEAVARWAGQVAARDGCIFHKHWPCLGALCDALEAVPVRVVTIVRDPYDQFVSLYHWLHARAITDRASGRVRAAGPHDALVGKPLDHPDVLAYLEREFPSLLAMANGWLHSGRAVVVRYEGLHRDPLGELTRATDQLAPVDPEHIERAIASCRAENMRQQSQAMASHVRAATVGDWRNYLTEAHLAIFRENHADLIRSLGYEVR